MVRSVLRLGASPACQTPTNSVRLTAPSWRTPPHVKLRSHDPTVDRAHTSPNSSGVAPARSTSTSSIQSRPTRAAPITPRPSWPRLWRQRPGPPTVGRHPARQIACLCGGSGWREHATGSREPVDIAALRLGALGDLAIFAVRRAPATVKRANCQGPYCSRRSAVFHYSYPNQGATRSQTKPSMWLVRSSTRWFDHSSTDKTGARRGMRLAFSARNCFASSESPPGTPSSSC